MDTTTCPECGAQAQVQRFGVLESTDGPIEHCKVRCVQGHWFLMPTSKLADRPGARDGAAAYDLTRSLTPAPGARPRR